MSRSRLLDLPAEIRLRIYDFYHPDRVIYANDERGTFKSMPQKTPSTWRKFRPLLDTSRLLRHEFLNYALAKSVVHLDSDGGEPSLLNYINNAALTRITHVCLENLHIHNPRVNIYEAVEQQWHGERFFTRCLKHLTLLPNLQRVDILDCKCLHAPDDLNTLTRRLCDTEDLHDVEVGFWYDSENDGLYTFCPKRRSAKWISLAEQFGQPRVQDPRFWGRDISGRELRLYHLLRDRLNDAQLQRLAKGLTAEVTAPEVTEKAARTPVKKIARKTAKREKTTN